MIFSLVIHMNGVEYDWVTVLFNMLLRFFGTVCLLNASTVIKFKSLLKTHLFNVAFNG